MGRHGGPFWLIKGFVVRRTRFHPVTGFKMISSQIIHNCPFDEQILLANPSLRMFPKCLGDNKTIKPSDHRTITFGYSIPQKITLRLTPD